MIPLRTRLHICGPPSWSPPDDFSPDLTKQDERDLLALRKRVNALRLHIAKMSRIALDAMEIDKGRSSSTGPDGGDCTARAGTVARSARKAAQAARRHDHHGRRPKCFERLTGMHPALRTNSEGVAYGPFLDFLKAVFEACRIAASAEAQAKAFQRKYRPSSI